MIVLYSTNCPRCNVLEAKLKAKNINFEINNNIDEMIEKGIQTAPVLEVHDELLQFKDAVDWINEQEG